MVEPAWVTEVMVSIIISCYGACYLGLLIVRSFLHTALSTVTTAEVSSASHHPYPVSLVSQTVVFLLSLGQEKHSLVTAPIATRTAGCRLAC